jgi:hypothetical protein
MASFPWRGHVRFDGIDFLATTLPWYYLPKLISIQLTLPALGLAAAGLVVSIRAVFQRRPNWESALLMVLWFTVPLVGVLVFRPSMYDNFRQFLFILPPLFILAAAALEMIFKWISSRRLQSLVGLAVLLPGIAAGIWLHPYEYIYYNALVGWTGQVERNYEGDYWFTSFCEAGRYINAVDPGPVRIALTDHGTRDLFRRCQEKKLNLVVERSEASASLPKYSIVPGRNDEDIVYFKQMPVVYTIGRGRTIFAVIKKAP